MNIPQISLDITFILFHLIEKSSNRIDIYIYIYIYDIYHNFFLSELLNDLTFNYLSDLAYF